MSIASLLARVIETERTIRDRENAAPGTKSQARAADRIVSTVEDEDEYVTDEKDDN